nr:hirsutellin [Culicinomyces clavisporus]
MKFLTALFAAAVCAPVLAAPVEADAVTLDKRVEIVNCRPLHNGRPKLFRVDVDVARAQARAAGLTTGRSGDPHRYFNGDNLRFGVHNCDKRDAILWEYPIYWVGKNAVWQKDTRTDRQPGGPTPLRVVYSNSNGGVQFCGVMTHSVVNDQNQGLNFFQRCLP